MKRIVFLLVLFALLLSACAGGTDLPTPTSTDLPVPVIRDLSTPASRLVGHWQSDVEIAKGYHIEYFYTEIDPGTGKGLATEYDPRDGTVFITTYVIISQAPEGEKLTILQTDASGFQFPLTDFEIAKDGLTTKKMKYTMTYIDGKTEYKP